VDIAGNRGPVTRYTFNVANPTAPVAAWQFDEGTGTTSADDNGNAHPVTIHGGSWTTSRASEFGSAYAFTGGNSYAETQGPVVDTARSVTLTAWVKIDAATTPELGRQAVVGQVGQNRPSFSITFDNATRMWWLLGLRDDTADPVPGTIVSSPARLDEWTHLAAVYDVADRSYRLYVNGQLAGTQNSFVKVWNATGPVEIARTKKGSAFADFLTGAVDDVRVYNRVVSADEIRAIAASTPASRPNATLH